MRLAWGTDLHLNFATEAQALALCAQARAAGAAGLVLTGDLAEAPSVEGWLTRLADALGLPLWFVLGNHDYYHGSIAGLRARLPALRGAQWLGGGAVVALTPHTALVGVDGWGDGRLGDLRAEVAVLLNDFLLIEELRAAAFAGGSGRPRRDGLRWEPLLEALRALGEAEAQVLRAALEQALAQHEDVLVLTHVPPFAEASFHEQGLSDPPWMPHFTCHATGEVLRALARAHPRRRLRVLCGHTHTAGRVQVLPNLEVLAGGARYRDPRLQGLVEVR